MSTEEKTPMPPPEEVVEDLEHAAEKWEARAEQQAEVRGEGTAKEELYRATADAMRHAQECVEERQAHEAAEAAGNEGTGRL